MGWIHAFVSLASAVDAACLVSCSATDEAPGSHVESPLEHRLSAAPARRSSAEASANAAPGTPPRMPSTERSLLDVTIAEAFPARPWSKNVPDRACAKDEECGDGFCDRDRCAPIWTYTGRYGQRCDASDPCGGQFCLEGRCRSCVSDAECVKETGVRRRSGRTRRGSDGHGGAPKPDAGQPMDAAMSGIATRVSPGGAMAVDPASGAILLAGTYTGPVDLGYGRPGVCDSPPWPAAWTG
jgi:hypothetical protein